jgi:hypothetical protein
MLPWVIGLALAYLENKEPQLGNFWHTTCQNVKLAGFQHFRSLTSSFLAYQMPYEPFRGLPKLPSHEEPIEPNVRREMMLVPACLACAQRIEVKEETNVEF